MPKVKIRENETASLQKLNRAFHRAMMKRILEKQAAGWTGWQERDQMSRNLFPRIIDNLISGDWVDVANLAMFAWNHDLKIKNGL